MEKLNRKQKILLILIIGAIVVTIAIFTIIYIKTENEIELFSEENLLGANIQEEKAKNEEEKENTIANKEGINNTTSNKNEENTNKIIVHITGEIKNAGIVELQEGARIADAIKKAGGIKNNADLEEINLAYVLQDGQKIYIPNKKDKNSNISKVYITSESGNYSISNTNNSGQKNTANSIKNEKGDKKVNINEASQSELETLPGIGPSLASRIMEYRKQNGKFTNVEDLQKVKGIGNAKFDKIKEYVRIQ